MGRERDRRGKGVKRDGEGKGREEREGRGMGRRRERGIKEKGISMGSQLKNTHQVICTFCSVTDRYAWMLSRMGPLCCASALGSEYRLNRIGK